MRRFSSIVKKPSRITDSMFSKPGGPLNGYVARAEDSKNYKTPHDKYGKGWVGFCADSRLSREKVELIITEFTGLSHSDNLSFAFPTTHISNEVLESYLGILDIADKPTLAAFLVHSNCAGAYYTLSKNSPLSYALEEGLWAETLQYSATNTEIEILRNIVSNGINNKESLTAVDLQVFEHYAEKVKSKFDKGEKALRLEIEAYANGLELPDESKKVYLSHLRRNAQRLIQHEMCNIAPENLLFFFYQHGNIVPYNTVTAFVGNKESMLEEIGSKKITKDISDSKDTVKIFNLPRAGEFQIEDRGLKVLQGVKLLQQESMLNNHLVGMVKGGPEGRQEASR